MSIDKVSEICMMNLKNTILQIIDIFACAVVYYILSWTSALTHNILTQYVVGTLMYCRNYENYDTKHNANVIRRYPIQAIYCFLFLIIVPNPTRVMLLLTINVYHIVYHNSFWICILLFLCIWLVDTTHV